MTYKIVLRDAFKTFTADQDKTLPPVETVERFKKKTRSLNLDILAGTSRIDNGRLDIPVFFSICGNDARRLTGTRKQMGKGATPEQAEASAVMELAERFSFFHFKNNEGNFFTETYRNTKEKAIPFELIAQSVNDSSPELEITKEIFKDLPLKWTRAYNLTLDREVLIPFDWFFTINEFNGPSAGNCNEEAICQGISEIVERHVCSIVSRRRARVPRIDPTSASDPGVVKMLEKYRRAGIRIHLSDFGLNTGIPTVGALAYDPTTFPESSEIIWTAGTAPDPQKALSRALTEVAQLAGDFNTRSTYVASGLPKLHTLDEADFIINTDKTTPIPRMPNLSDPNIRIEIERYVSALKKNNMQVLLINTTHKELDVPAFYTIIPGALFRERATGTSIGMFTAKMITEKFPPRTAVAKLQDMNTKLPGKHYVHFYIGTMLIQLGEHEKALPHLDLALQANPEPQDIPTILSYTGLCLKELGRYREALERLERGANADNEREDIFNLMGFCNFMLKKHDKAIDCFKSALRLNPNSAIDYANIASNYRDMGKKKKAASYYRMALELDPDIGFARDNLDRILKADNPA